MLAALLLLLCFLTPAWAQEKGWENEWERVLAAAKKEGKVVVQGSPDPVMRRRLLPMFQSRFGIAVEYLAGRASEIAARVRTERAAGLYTIDVYLSGPDTTAVTLHGEKMIDPAKPLLILPEVLAPSKWKMGKPWFIDPEERYVLRLFRSITDAFIINTDHVKPDEIRAAKDLLNPKWKGKISAEDPLVTGAGANDAGRLLLQLGEEFIKKLYADQKVARTRDRRQMADWLARGIYPICLNCRQDDVRPLQKLGFKLKTLYELSDVPTRVNASPLLVTLGGRAPHPNAARVFLNWFASKEPLELYSRDYEAVTLRTDVDESFLPREIIPSPGVNYFDDADWNWIITERRQSREKAQQLLREFLQ